MSPVRRRHTAPLRALVLALAVVSAGTVGGAPAYATTDAVTITSPADGSTVVVAGDPADVSAPVPVQVTFTSSGDPATCALDDQPAVACTSPYTFASVPPGGHAVTVTAGSASAVSHFTLSVVVLAPPPDAPLYRPQAGTRLHQAWSVHGSRTRVKTLRLSDLQRKVRVVVLCHGRGCRNAKPYAAQVSGSARLTPALRHWDLRPGTRVVVRISKRGYATKRYVMVVQPDVAPTVSWSWVH
jgi:hypothetical protein